MTWAKPPASKSADFIRIQALPVRGEYPPNLVEMLTAVFKTPNGTQTLLEVQARALWDLGTYGCGCFPIPVGRGKTLISLLAARVLRAKVPFVLMPANLCKKSRAELANYAKDWRVSTHVKFLSYEMLGREQGAKILELVQPDMLFADEAHKLKNPRAACTRRVMRYMQGHPNTWFLPASGTFMKKSLKDFAHLLEWSHGQYSPCPLHRHTLEEWCEALDEKVNPMARRSPGVLLDLAPFSGPPHVIESAQAAEVPDADRPLVDIIDDADLRAARQAFHTRLAATPGVVFAPGGKDEHEGPLVISALEYAPNAKTEENFQILRETACRPDGWALAEAMQLWAVARQLALGLHYAWKDPQPEQSWLDARKAFAKFVRETLEQPFAMAHGIDSEKQVVNAVISGALDDEYGVVAEWRKLRPTYEAHTIDIWHDESALRVCADWLTSQRRAICWTDHVLFAKTLSRMTGVPYFGADGVDDKNNYIEHHEGNIIASRAANSTGKNLQFKWSNNLVTAPPADSEQWEQMLGRTHRKGQPEDDVTVDVLVACKEHLQSIPRALASAGVKADLLGARQKLHLADIDWPDTTVQRKGFRW